MLSVDQIRKISNHFSVYEHEWRYLQCYVGEPFEYKDYLIFDDGKVLNICAFSLSNERTLCYELLSEIVKLYFRKKSHKVIHIWGEFEVPKRLSISESISMDLLDEDSICNLYDGEYTIDLTNHDLTNLKEARKSVRSIKNKGLDSYVRQTNMLSARHRELIEIWRLSRPIPITGAIAAHGVSSFLMFKENIFLVEVRYEKVIVGFSIFSFVGENNCVNIMSFSDKIPGIKIEDALIYETIKFARQKGKKTLHLGYAGNRGLVSFKKKWGAEKTGPNYKQALYTLDQRWFERVSDFNFFWVSRLLSPID